MPRWIGFTGKMGAGKDYAYRWLFERGHDVNRVSFADQLRFEIRDTLGLVDVIEKPYTELERKLQQWWGTEYRRAEDPDYWVKKAEQLANEVHANGWTPVFTDVRFPNEADMVREHGGLIVRLSASSSTRAERLDLASPLDLPNHASETAMDNYRSDVWIPTDMGDKRFEQDMRGLVRRAGLGTQDSHR